MERDDYLAYRNLLLGVGQDQIGKYDRSLMVLSSGAIGLSITLLRGQEPIQNLWILGLSWALLILSLVSIVFSQFCGFKASRFDLQQIDDSYEDNGSYEWKSNLWSSAVEYLNMISGLAFCAGAIALTIFSYQEFQS